VRSGRVELRVPPTPARFLRITQLGDEPFWGWSVRELFVYADDPSGAWIVPDGDVEALARAVHAAGVTRLYADAGWASRIALAHPEIRVLPANLSVDAYGYAPAADRLPTVRWEPGSGALLVEGPDADGFEQTAGASNLRWTHRDVAGFRLFVYAPPPPLPGRPIATDDLHLSAAIHSEGAPRAADGRRHTRWTTGRARQAGDWLRIDLRELRRVRGVRLWTSDPDGSPGELEVEGTTDGATFSTLAPLVHRAGPMAWGGFTSLRDGVDTVRLDFAPTVLRGIRLTLRQGDAKKQWSVHELVVYADDPG